MSRSGFVYLAKLSDTIRAGLSRVEVLALFPALALAAVWFGNQDLLLVSAFLLPALLAIQAMGQFARNRDYAPPAPMDGLTGLPMRPALEGAVARTLTSGTGKTTVVILIHIDELDAATDRWGSEACDTILQRCAERLRIAVRDADVVARNGDAGFGIVLHPVRSARLDVILGLTERLQAALSEPIAMGRTAAYVTASIGYCSLSQAPSQTPKGVMEAADAALAEARHNGPSATRAYAPEFGVKRRKRAERGDSIEAALTGGEIKPWFQPQVSTDTGVISGFEALARWHHPEEGVLPPVEFLDAIADAGLMAKLGEVMLFHALSALRSWDKAGLSIPSVAVNFSADELRDPGLADRVKWEVDRFDLRPARLTVEILETVAAQSENDIIIRNIQMLGTHGFNLDLDDFGTGQASIANIRRFRVNRIKIDRSFVTRLDQDPEQQAMVTAILSLAEHLGIDTLAEGVETVSEHSLLAQLGCGHVQGFGLARPMPFEDTIAWVRTHREKLNQPARIGRQAG